MPYDEIVIYKGEENLLYRAENEANTVCSLFLGMNF
jgi:hypothetical protein